MPDPPSVSFLNQWVLENPWPLAVVLAAIAFAVGYSALVQGHLKRLPAALVLAAAAVGAIAAGLLVKTSGERAESITRDFVAAVEDEDAKAATALLATNATFAFDSPRNPGHDLAYIKAQLRRVLDEYAIESNSITRLDGYAESGGTGVAHLTCWTHASGGYGPVRSQWVIEVTRQSDGSWLISRLTCVKINEREASSYR